MSIDAFTLYIFRAFHFTTTLDQRMADSPITNFQQLYFMIAQGPDYYKLHYHMIITLMYLI